MAKTKREQIDTSKAEAIATASENKIQRIAKEELRKLFDKYDAAAKVFDECKDALEQAKIQRSNTVQAICSATGSKGPYKLKNGTVVTVVVRTNKEGGASTWYFKGPGLSELIEV